MIFQLIIQNLSIRPSGIHWSRKSIFNKCVRLLFEEDISLSLPYIKIGKESGIPEIAGTALFNKREFTGETLDKKESILLNLLRKKQGKYTRLSYMWKSGGKESPLTVEVIEY